MPRVPFALTLAFAIACGPSTDDADGDGLPDQDPGGSEVTPADDTIDQVKRNQGTSSGAFALDYLRASPWTSLHVEIDHVTGHPPSRATLDAIDKTLEALCNKPGGVTVAIDDVLDDQGSPRWTVSAANELELEHRDRYHDPETLTAVLYMLYLDGRSDRDDDDSSVLGYAVHGSSIVMFPETIAGLSSGPLGFLSDPEPLVATHEVGHVLGLVNNGVAMQEPHQDAERGAHDNDEDCLMYWAVESSAIVDILGNRTPEFDDACLADLAAAGGRPVDEARAALP